MRPEEPTFWLLNGAVGWRTGDHPGIAVAEDSGIRLAADPEGPLSLTTEDGSLGGLVLPIGMAFDAERRLYLLDTLTSQVKRYEVEQRAFESLSTIGGEGESARQLQAPSNIAIVGDDLYIIDAGNRRVQVFALATLTLRHVWGPWDESLRVVDVDAEEAWSPVDVAALDDHVYLLDSRYGRVLKHRLGTDRLVTIISQPETCDRWTRIAVDTDQCIYLLDPNGPTPKLDQFSAEGEHLAEVYDVGALLDRFEAPLIRSDHLGRFCLPSVLADACPGDAIITSPPVGDPLIHCRSEKDGLLFDRNGWRLGPIVEPEIAGSALYLRSGTWTSEALDSAIFACQWHRIELELADLPAGVQVMVSTYTDNVERSIEEINALPKHLWETQYRILGQMQPSVEAGQPNPHGTDTLVLSHEGQYLWLRLQLYGDGYATPVVSALRTHYPRDSYLKYLPAVYSEDEESRRFMERFLSLFQAQWDEMEQRVDDFAMYLDPDAVPEGRFLSYLAEWLALPLEGSWAEAQKRRLLSAAPEIYKRRGTPQALQAYLEIYLSNITGIETQNLLGFPVIIEGFRWRDYLLLSVPDHAVLGQHHALWSPAVVGRLQLDVFAREGQVRLVSTGDPDRDVFHVHAHRFQVVLPSAWVGNRDAEVMLQRALDSEKPAQSAYDLCLVEPRFRVGVQSTIGLDTIIGEYPSAVLTRPDDEEEPLNRPPRNRLGYDSVLGGRAGERGGMPVGRETRVGVNTQLS